MYIVFCCLHCDCLGLAAIKWFLTAFETLNLLTYLLNINVILNNIVLYFIYFTYAILLPILNHFHYIGSKMLEMLLIHYIYFVSIFIVQFI